MTPGPAVVLVALLLAGCAAHAEPAAKPKPPKAPIDGQWYASTADLLKAMGDVGVNCTGYTKIDNPANGAVELGTCNLDGDPSRDVPVSIYASTADAENGIKGPASFGGTFLAGQNWTINIGSDPGVADRLKKGMGGRLLSTTR